MRAGSVLLWTRAVGASRVGVRVWRDADEGDDGTVWLVADVDDVVALHERIEFGAVEPARRRVERYRHHRHLHDPPHSASPGLRPGPGKGARPLASPTVCARRPRDARPPPLAGGGCAFPGSATAADRPASRITHLVNARRLPAISGTGVKPPAARHARRFTARSWRGGSRGRSCGCRGRGCRRGGPRARCARSCTTTRRG